MLRAKIIHCLLTLFQNESYYKPEIEMNEKGVAFCESVFLFGVLRAHKLLLLLQFILLNTK